MAFASKLNSGFRLLSMNYLFDLKNVILFCQLMVNGHIGPVGPHVMSRVAREGNYGQEGVQIQCQIMVDRIVLGKV
jgi:hypothetical protein